VKGDKEGEETGALGEEGGHCVGGADGGERLVGKVGGTRGRRRGWGSGDVHPSFSTVGKCCR
jgi:hypothetical protein